MGQHLLALVMIEHAGHRAAFDRGEHRQHHIGGIALHDADDVPVAHTVLSEHGRVPVGGLVGFGVTDLLVAVAQESPVAVAGGTFGEDLADRSPRVRLG